jgi:hypothetical protein
MGKTNRKKIITGLIAFVAFISFSLARYAINLTLGVDPSHFPYALVAITTIVTPFAWLIFSIGFLFLLYAFSLFYAFLINAFSTLNTGSIVVSIQNSRYYRFLFKKKVILHYRSKIFLSKAYRVFARAMACATLLLLFCFPLNEIAQNSLFIDKFFTNLIVITNFYPISGCKSSNKHVSGEAYAFIGDGMVSVAVPNKNGGYTFEPPRKCNQEKTENQVKK